MDGLKPQVITRNVTYHDDASLLFHCIGGTQEPDSVLLESADIESKTGIQSLAVLRGSMRITCSGQNVTCASLTPSGVLFLAQLVEQLKQYVTNQTTNTATFTFPQSTEADEAARLVAPSSIMVLRQLQQHSGYRSDNGQLPLIAGGFAFDYLDTFEQLPPVLPGQNTFADYQFLLAEIVLRINHQTKTAELAAVAASEELAPAIANQLEQLEKLIATADTSAYRPLGSTPAERDDDDTLTATADTPDAPFRRSVVALQENIYQGDIYQVVPARSFSLACPDAFAAYRQLRAQNPSPYMMYLRGIGPEGRWELFGASPESNLKYTAATRTVELYPIAGTKPRGATPELDTRAELELRTDAKEVAEHTMLVDLARNDLARVAEPGTRHVAALLQVDRYSHVMHLVSRVTAKLRADLDALDAYRACMNMGTLTGAPKLKAMELLRGVEGRRRGSYGGAIGYLAGGGDMDTCIVIRSAYVVDGTAIVQAGAGVVRDSKPQAEADETLHKAYAVLSAIAAAQGKKLEVVR